MAAPLDDTKKSEIVKLHDRGMEPAEIARQLNIGHAAVHTHLREHELELLRGGPALTAAEIASLEIHDFCYLYPEHSEEAIDRLGESIAKNGLDVPLVVWRRKDTFDGRTRLEIIDGRGRFMACRNRGIALKPSNFVCFEGDEAGAREKVDRLNLERRHLSREEEERQRSQRAMRAAKKAIGENGGKLTRESREQAAKEAGVSRGYVTYAAEIAKKAPEAAEQVAEGKKTIQDARRDAGLDRRHVKRTEPEGRTTLAEVAEDHEEKAAVRDQDGDDAWLESLPLHGKLSGRPRKLFVEAAIDWRNSTAERKAWAAKVASLRKGNSTPNPWLRRHVRALTCGDPSDWEVCGEDGNGCGGSGVMLYAGQTEDCPNCKGDGFRVC